MRLGLWLNRPMQLQLIIRTAITLATIIPALAGAEIIAVIGTGDVGSTLGTRFAQAGHSVYFGSRTPESERVQALLSEAGENVAALTPPQAAAAADMIVLAVPHDSAVDVLQSLGDTAGKVVIDVTNPLIRSEGRYARATDDSVAAQLQAAAPEAHIVKALNALAYRTMAEPELAGGTVTIPMAGNDAAAKARVASLIADLGFDSWDLGPVEYAGVLEDMLMVRLHARLRGRAFNYYFRPAPHETDAD